MARIRAGPAWTGESDYPEARSLSRRLRYHEPVRAAFAANGLTNREGCMGTAKYDHPGYVADLGDRGHYRVGLWRPHGYPAHIHIGRQDAPEAAMLRLRIADSVFQSLSEDTEMLCRRALGQAMEEGLLDASQSAFQETRFHPDAAPWQGPLAQAQ